MLQHHKRRRAHIHRLHNRCPKINRLHRIDRPRKTERRYHIHRERSEREQQIRRPPQCILLRQLRHQDVDIRPHEPLH